jgi:hypothetical protein
MAIKYQTDLRNLEYSSEANPLIEPTEIVLKRRRVKTGKSRDMLDPLTNEVIGVTAIFQVEERDDAEFVKVFSEGVKAAFNLTKTAYRVFHAVLDVYQGTRMSGSYADSVYLAWFDGGLSGAQIDMSEYTFKRGLRELLDKSFLAPRAPNLFWVNPSLFFKGDRVAFVKEYRRKRTIAIPEPNDDKHQEALSKQEELEALGQQRLVE